jgi:LPS O-antigen subunit length determinant protein (WzzB/FepE family)
MEEKQIELIDYLQIIWRRKWIIVMGTIFSIIIAGTVSLLLKPVYEIDAIIQPGKLFIQDQAGNFNQFVIEQPQQIADKVSHKSYDANIASELKISEEDLPKMAAENIKNTLLARIWIRNHDIKLSKKVLDSLISFIKKDMDEKIDIALNNVDSGIKSNEIEKERRMGEIEILKKKLRILDQRKNDIAGEMQSIKDKVGEIEKEQLKVLKKEGRSEIESMAMLLYSNEIQQSLEYYDILNEKLIRERLDEEDVNSSIQDETAQIAKLDTLITNLKQRKGMIDHTKIIKAPTSSVHPVKPKKDLNILMAAILSIVVFSVLILLIENVKKYKWENQQK